MLHEASQVGFTSLNISYLKYGHLTCAKWRGFLYNHGGRQVSWHGDPSRLLRRWLFPWTRGHVAVCPGVPPHLRQQKPSEMSHTQATLPAGLLSPHATLLTPPCPCLPQVFPWWELPLVLCATPRLASERVVCETTPGLRLSTSRPQGPQQGIGLPVPSRRPAGTTRLVTVNLEVFPGRFKFIFLMILTWLILGPRVQGDSFKKIEMD